MLLECPSCHAQFSVPDSAIPPAGRTVRCSACKHQWHAMVPPPAAPAVEAPAPVEPEAPNVPIDHSFLEELARATDAPDESVPAEPAVASEPIFEEPVIVQQAAPSARPVAPKPFKFSLPIWPFRLAAPSLAVIWLVVAMFAYFPGWQDAPVLGGIYRAMGVVPTDGVVLADVAMQREDEGQRTRFLISGNIINQEAHQRQIPVVRVQMMSRENEVIWSREYDVGKVLEPGEIYPFRITNAETSFAHSVSQLVVDMGHPLQMMFR